MFGKDKTMALSPDIGGTTLIAKGTEVCGDLRFAGNLEIEGKVTGDIIASDGSKASVRILEQGQVDGDLHVPSIVINGQINGDVHSSEFVELASKARVTGNVHYGLIEMVKGAQVNGNLVYASGDKKASLTEVKPSSSKAAD